MSYTHPTEVEQYDIYEQKREGLTLTEIARRLRRSKSTISRELRRNAGKKGYRPRQAQQNAEARLMTQRGGLHICPRSWKRCRVLLERGYSPAQASGRLRHDDFAPIIHETIYKRIYEDKFFGGSIWRNLRCTKKRRKRYVSGRQRRGRIPNRTGIEKRCP